MNAEHAPSSLAVTDSQEMPQAVEIAPPKASRWVGWALFAASILAAFAYPLYDFFAWESQFPEYQSFPFILAAVIGIAYFRFRDADKNIKRQLLEAGGRWTPRTPPAWLGHGLTVIASLGCLFGVLVWSPWVIVASFFLLIAGVLVYVTRRKAVPGIWPVWCLLFLVLPLPLNLDYLLTTKLQLLSSWLSSQVLEAIGILHLLRGNALTLTDKELFVDEACSGIVSLITIVAAIAIYCVWHRRSIVHTFAMILSGIVWTILMNTLRITTIAVMLDKFQIDWSSGWTHSALAIVLFVVSLGVLKALDFFLFEVFRPVDAQWRFSDHRDRTEGKTLMILWDKWFSNQVPLEEHTYYDDYDIRRKNSSKSVKKSTSPKKKFDLKQSVLGFIQQTPVSKVLNWPAMILLMLAAGLQPLLLTADDDAVYDSKSSLEKATQLAEADSPGNGLEGFELVKFESATRETHNILGEHSRIWYYRDSEGRQYTVSLDFMFGPLWHDLSVCYTGTGWNVERFEIKRQAWESSGAEKVWPIKSMYLTRLPEEMQGHVAFCGIRADGTPVTQMDAEQAERWRVILAKLQGAKPIGPYLQLQVVTFGGQMDESQRANAERLLAHARESLVPKVKL